jgi:hypothetical protein
MILFPARADRLVRTVLAFVRALTRRSLWLLSNENPEHLSRPDSYQTVDPSIVDVHPNSRCTRVM